MAVAHDAASESHTGTTGSTSEGSFTWSHNPVGVPKGVLVFVWTNANADYITSVTYDGTALTQISEAADTAGEPGRCTAFFLGTSVPTTDPANIVVTRTNNATVMYGVGITVTAASDTETTGVTLVQENATPAEVSVDDGSVTGANSVRYAAMHYGGNSVPGAGASSTVVHGIDLGATQTFNVVQETTAGTGSRSIGFSAAADDVAAIHLAIRETTRKVTPSVGSLVATGLAAAVALTIGLQVRGYAPTVTQGGAANTTITPSVGSLTLTGAAPTVSATDHQTVTPPVGSLAMTGLNGTVTASDHQTATPTTGSLTLTGAAPTCTATDHQTATPVAGTLVLAGAAPTVSSSDIQTVTPGVGALTLTGYAPTLSLAEDVTVTPDVGRLVFGVSGSLAITPSVGGLTLTGYAPTVSSANNTTVTPGAGSLILTGNASSLGTTIRPPVAVLKCQPWAQIFWDANTDPDLDGYIVYHGIVTNTYTESVDVGNVLTYVWNNLPYGTNYFAVTAYDTSANESAHSSEVSTVISGSGFAPTVINPAVAQPGVGSLTLTGYAPTVSVTTPTLVTPGVGAMTLTGAAPTVTASDHQSITPGVGSLTLTGEGPTVAATDHQTATPTAGSLLLTGYAPTVTVEVFSPTITPEPATLTLTAYAPTVTATVDESLGFYPGGGGDDAPPRKKKRTRTQLVTLANQLDTTLRETLREMRTPTAPSVPTTIPVSQIVSTYETIQTQAAEFRTMQAQMAALREQMQRYQQALLDEDDAEWEWFL